MTTVSDGSTPPGIEPGPPLDLGLHDTTPVALPPTELPAPPPLLSHLQPEAQAEPRVDPPAEAPPRRSRLPRDTPSGAGRVLLPIVLCVVGVVGLGAGWVHLEADRAAEAQARVATDPEGKPPVPSLGSPAAGAPAAPSASSSAPAASPSASGAPSPSASASSPPATPSTPVPSATPAAPVVDRSVPVVVLNATSRTGLAAAVAERLRDRGWTVASVGNWRSGGVSTTTVFATGRADAAATLRRDAKPADATRRTLAGMPKNRLVLVIGPDYPRVT